jgi:hypothetical protein
MYQNMDNFLGSAFVELLEQLIAQWPHLSSGFSSQILGDDSLTDFRQSIWPESLCKSSFGLDGSIELRLHIHGSQEDTALQHNLDTCLQSTEDGWENIQGGLPPEC